MRVLAYVRVCAFVFVCECVSVCVLCTTYCLYPLRYISVCLCVSVIACACLPAHLFFSLSKFLTPPPHPRCLPVRSFQVERACSVRQTSTQRWLSSPAHLLLFEYKTNHKHLAKLLSPACLLLYNESQNSRNSEFSLLPFQTKKHCLERNCKNYTSRWG